MPESSAVTTFVFTDIEGSTRLWEEQPERMRAALACHDALARKIVCAHRGSVVKTTGDGVHAVFDDPLDAIVAALEFQQALADPAATAGIALAVRCGMHAGVVERRDQDYFGTPVNRAARLMGVAHGGQVLLSRAVASLVEGRLPAEVTLRDLGAVRLRDLAHPEYVYQLLHPTLRPDFPALHSLETTPNNLPQQVTSFVGRERELGEVKALLAKTRLLTLAGAGGLGKSRLSLQIAADEMDSYPDGVFLVELAALADPQLVPQAIASVHGVKEEAGRPIVDALARYVKSRRALLVLDNCEHLLQACADVAAALLQAGAQFKIIASSRERLRVQGETIYHVAPLGVPDTREPSTPEQLLRCESVRLFVERAGAVQPSFRITAANAAAVAEICSRLDGIPLALELAAARIRALSAEKIAERLGDRFNLLTGGGRTVMPRHQTLRALIDWSYDLLEPPERTLLQRLAVFAGGWTLEAAEAIGAGGAIEVDAVLDLLARLVEKSLVSVDADRERYRLLDTVRHYALERLGEAGDAAATRTRHLRYYVALGEAAAPALVGPDQAKWLRRLDFEQENMLAAHAWCEHVEGGGELGLRLFHSTKHYWPSRGLFGLHYRLIMTALAHAEAQARTRARCHGLFDAGQICCFIGRYGEALRYLEESLQIARELSDQHRVEATLQLLGMASLGQGDLDNARRCLEEALTLARAQGDKRELASAINALAQLHRIAGAVDAAEPLYNDVLGLSSELGDHGGVAIAKLNLAMVSVSRGALERAGALLLEVHAIAQATGSKPAGQSVLEVTAGLAAARGLWDESARLFGAVEALTGATGLHRDPADEAFLAPRIASAREALGASAFAAAEAEGALLTYEQAMQRARSLLDGAASSGRTTDRA